jgi:hypothetical protein
VHDRLTGPPNSRIIIRHARRGAEPVRAILAASKCTNAPI